MPDIVISVPSISAAPKNYTIPGAQELILKNIAASFDGTSASGAWVPAVQILSPAGIVVGTYVLGQSLAVGALADVTWFPGVGSTLAVSPTTPGAVLDYQEPPAGTLNITATTATTAQSWIVGNAITLDGLTRVHIETWIALATTNADVVAELYDNGADVARLAQCGSPVTGPGAMSMSLYGSAHITPTAGSHQYEVRAWKDAGSTGAFLNPSPFAFNIFSPSYYQVTVDPKVT